ncbi:MAG TPA: hypothetical protein VG013_40745 [Gemmataceae bacterium]|jgi:hypothetical protein|nr:hypothetical protein [Gemmataceae bacterium]
MAHATFQVGDLTAVIGDDGSTGVRFTHSPSGGGANRKRQTTNPAWDCQYLLPRYEVNKEYSPRLRVIDRARCDRAEVMREWERWHKTR